MPKQCDPAKPIRSRSQILSVANFIFHHRMSTPDYRVDWLRLTPHTDTCWNIAYTITLVLPKKKMFINGLILYATKNLPSTSPLTPGLLPSCVPCRVTTASLVGLLPSNLSAASCRSSSVGGCMVSTRGVIPGNGWNMGCTPKIASLSLSVSFSLSLYIHICIYLSIEIIIYSSTFLFIH